DRPGDAPVLENGAESAVVRSVELFGETIVRERSLQERHRHRCPARLERGGGRGDYAAAEAVTDEVDRQIGIPLANANERRRETYFADGTGACFHLVIRREVCDAPRRRLRAGQKVSYKGRAALIHVSRPTDADLQFERNLLSEPVE